MTYTVEELRDRSRGDTDAMLDWCADEIERLRAILTKMPETILDAWNEGGGSVAAMYSGGQGKRFQAFMADLDPEIRTLWNAERAAEEQR